MDRPKKRRVYPVRRSEQPRTPHSIHSIHDLIRISQTGVKYSNLNTEMLWKITPQLVDIDQMIGMRELKNTLFYQIIYYLQDLFIDDSREYLHTVIMGAPGSGKCLGRDTELILYDGTLRKVQDIVQGDVLMGDDSTPRTVLSVCTGREQMYRIRTPTYAYIVNQSHILSCINSSGEFVDLPLTDVINTEEEMFGYKVSYRIQHEHGSEVDPYILGYVLSSLHHSTPTIKLHRDAYFQYFSSYQAISRVPGTFEYQLKPSFLPEWMISSSSELESYILHLDLVSQYVLLSGFLDSHQRDENSNEIHLFLQTSFSIYTLILRLLDQLGIPYHLDQTEYTLTDGLILRTTSLTEMTIETTTVPFFLSDTTWSPPTTRQVLSFPMVIEPLEEDDYFGFELDGNHRFLLQDGTVTHNTTIAKIIGEMYKNMGILSPDGHFRIAKREDFVAEYLGQTAIKTKKLLEQCKGGVLFIDEVYALGPGKKDSDSFSKEAIDTLNVFLSENHNTFCCIIAGYEEDIRHCFFSVNQGLERRFQWAHHIGEYSSQDLVDIFFKLLSESCWSSLIDASLMMEIVTVNPDLFVSFGGSMENLITKCKMAHAKRLLNHHDVKKHQLTNADVKEGIELMKQNQVKEEEKDDSSHRHMYV